MRNERRMGIFDEIEKRGNVTTWDPSKKIGLKEFEDLCNKMDTGKSSQNVMYVSVDGGAYINATLKGDKAEIFRLDTKFTKQAFEKLKAEHKSMMGEGYDVFCELERRFKRKNGTFDMRWDTGMVLRHPDPEMEPSTATIKYSSGEYSVFINFSDETGYLQETIWRGEDMDHDELMETLESMGL